MAKSIERYFRLMPKAHAMRPGGRLWYPSADVYRTREGWVVKVELAGVSSEQVEVQIEGDGLRVSGCRRDSICSETLFCQQMEITYSHFEKMIRFPCPIEGATLRMDYRDGLLLLYLRSPEFCEEEEQADHATETR